MDDPHQLRAEHTKEKIRERLATARQHSYLKDFVYGSIDGVVTSFAIVAGVAGAELTSKIVVVLGIANLLGDGFSMATGNYLATRTESQVRETARKDEERHIELYPEGEREEVKQLLEQKGFSGTSLEDATDVITSDVNRWIDMMLTEEHGLPVTTASPTKAAAITFLAFVLAGSVPLAPFVLSLAFGVYVPNVFALSAFLTACTFFAVGAGKSKFVEQWWLLSGLETCALGSVAALIAYAVGYFLEKVIAGS